MFDLTFASEPLLLPFFGVPDNHCEEYQITASNVVRPFIGELSTSFCKTPTSPPNDFICAVPEPS